MLDHIEEAIEAIQRGEIIIVVDDEDRENEGDFLTAARNATPEVINFMATHGRGLICAPLLEGRCDALGLELMVNQNNAAYETPFTVSVDLIGHGCTTGISAADRSKTIHALIDPKTTKDELGKPGHIFPLRAKPGGVLRRAGHTEAAVDFARLAGFEPAGVIVEIMNEDGTMARLNDCRKIADEWNLKLVSIADLIAFRLKNETLIEKVEEVQLETMFGTLRILAFKQTTNETIHLAVVKGEPDVDSPTPVRVHSSSMIGDVFQLTTHGKGPQLQSALDVIGERDCGVVVYINKLRSGGGLLDELRAYKKMSTSPDDQKQNVVKSRIAHPMDSKDYGIGAQILREVGVGKIELLTDSVRKTGPIGYGLEIVSTTPLRSISDR